MNQEELRICGAISDTWSTWSSGQCSKEPDPDSNSDMSLCVWSVLLLTLQISAGEEQNCYRGPQASIQLADWISRAMRTCRLTEAEHCQVEQFQDIELTRLGGGDAGDGGDAGSWYITSGWSLTNPQFPRVAAYQGAFYYDELPGENGVRRGVYLYPDWSSCVSGKYHV